MQADLPKLPTILPGEPARPASTPVAALTEAANIVQDSAASAAHAAPSGTAHEPAAAGRISSSSSGMLSEPAASSTASAMTQQAALQSGAGSVTSQRGQGWLRAMWNRYRPPMHDQTQCSGPKWMRLPSRRNLSSWCNRHAALAACHGLCWAA